MKLLVKFPIFIAAVLISACSTTKNASSKEFKKSDYDKVIDNVSEGPEYKLLQDGYNYGFYCEGEGVILPAKYFLKEVRYDGSALFTMDEPFCARNKGKWGKIHMDGTISVEFKYDYLIETDSLYYQDGNEIGIWNDGFDRIISTDYKHLMGNFSIEGNDVLLVSKDGTTIIYLDPKTGKEITPEASDISNEFCIVHVDGKFGLYDLTGAKYLGETEYDLVKNSNGSFYFMKDGKEEKVIGMNELWKE